MVDSREMDRVLTDFASRFNAKPELAKMTAGWERTIAIEPSDAAWRRDLRVERGLVRTLEQVPEKADIRLVGRSSVLADIFAGRLSPTEPYLDGDLVVHSSEEDMMKLDIFTLMVWGE